MAILTMAILTMALYLQITQLASEVNSHSVSTGAFVVREGERADSLFFVREGQVVCTHLTLALALTLILTLTLTLTLTLALG
jgi:CRP-like cAMP-binding protein